MKSLPLDCFSLHFSKTDTFCILIDCRDLLLSYSKTKKLTSKGTEELKKMSDEESYEYEYDDDDMDEEGFQYTDEEEEANDGEVALGEFDNSNWK